MRIISLCLLVFVSASCLLGTNANAYQSSNLEEIQSFGDDGFIKSMEKALKKVLTTVRGVNCSIKAVIEVMNAATEYIDAVDACGTAVPKQVAKIVKSCKDIIEICDNIIHLHSKLCSQDESKLTSPKCFYELSKAMMTLTYKINSTLKQIKKLPADTEACFVDATNKVEDSFNSFLPNIEKCVDEM